MRTEIPVYLPTDEASIRALIDPRSGIVGSTADEWGAAARPGHIVLDFEGNRFGASNVVTFADRVYHAASRHEERYPTVARTMAPEQDVIRVGTYHPEHGRVEVHDGLSLFKLAAWLDLITPQQSIDGDALNSELRRWGR